MAYCELYDHGDGTFTLNVKPQEAGRHALTIKYGGKYHPSQFKFCVHYTSHSVLHVYSIVKVFMHPHENAHAMRSVSFNI